MFKTVTSKNRLVPEPKNMAVKVNVNGYVYCQQFSSETDLIICPQMKKWFVIKTFLWHLFWSQKAIYYIGQAFYVQIYFGRFNSENNLKKNPCYFTDTFLPSVHPWPFTGMMACIACGRECIGIATLYLTVFYVICPI